MLMEDPRDAEDAVRELDGSRMCGRKVKVNISALRKDSDNRAESIGSSRVSL